MINLNQETTLIFVICYSICTILIYKFLKFKAKIKNMEFIDAICTDKTLRTTYQKNIRMYFYSYKYNEEDFQTSDSTRLNIPGFNPQINKVFKIYIDPKNPQNCVTPLEIYYSKIYIITAVILLFLPFLLII